MGNRSFFSFLVAIFFFASLTSTAAALSDVEGHEYKTSILYAQEKGIVAGYSDGTFRPNTLVNRAELVKILIASTFSQAEISNCKDGLSTTATTMYFLDTNREDWYAPYLCLGYTKGFIKGYPDGTFHAGDNITTIEATKLITLVLGYKIEEDLETWYRPYLMKMESLRALPKSLKYITAPVTRAEITEMIWRIREHKTGEYSISGNTLIRNQLLKDQGKL